MAKPLKYILNQSDDSLLCDGLLDRIINFHGPDLDVSEISKEERVVILVSEASGVIGNGGFRFLFERNFKGDPHFALTADAFRATGCKKAADAVDATLAIFPNSRPPANIHKRLHHYLQRVKEPTDMELQFFAAEKDLVKCLASYVRSHADAYAHLNQRKPKLPFKFLKPSRLQSKQQRKGETISSLPHWARVALAAQCARLVLPLLAQYWPDVPPNRHDAIAMAIRLAEHSACQARALDGLKAAVLNALMAAGAALISRPELAHGEPRPPDGFSGTIASFVAKAAEKAAESALADAKKSRLAASESWGFAAGAANCAERPDITKLMQVSLSSLHREAASAKWTDRTPIPFRIWEEL
jgi:hypothetical protein